MIVLSFSCLLIYLTFSVFSTVIAETDRSLCRNVFRDKAIAHDAIDLEVLAGFIISPINDIERCVRVCENEWRREVRNRRPFVRCRAVYFNPNSRSNATRCVALSHLISEPERQLTYEQDSYVYNACPPSSKHIKKLKLIDQAFESRRSNSKPSSISEDEEEELEGEVEVAEKRRIDLAPRIPTDDSHFKKINPAYRLANSRPTNNPSSAQQFSFSFPNTPKTKNFTTDIFSAIRKERLLEKVKEDPNSQELCDISDGQDRYGDYICGVKGTQPFCGVPPYRADRSESNQYPWLVSIWKNGRFVCSGSLIQADFTNQNVRWTEFVITAASCLVDQLGRFLDTKDLHVVAGRDRVGPAETSFRRYNVANIWVPPDYSGAESHLDMGLLRLDRWMLFSPEIRHVCLPQVDYNPVQLDQCITLGWGWTAPFTGSIRGAQANPLHVPIEKADLDYCRTENGKSYNEPPLLCVKSTTYVGPGGEPNYGSLCPGDAGAPLICVSKGRWTLVGTAVRTPLKCQTGRYTVFTDMIDKSTRQLIADGFVALLRDAGDAIFI